VSGWDYFLSLSPEGADDFTVQCAPARNLEVRKVDGRAVYRVVVYVDGIEVEGWSRHEFASGAPTCHRVQQITAPDYPRILDERGVEARPPLEEGYVALPPMDKLLLARTKKWFGTTRSLFVPSARGKEVTCTKFELNRGYLVTLYPPTSGVVKNQRALEITSDGIHLSLEDIHSRNGLDLVGGSFAHFQVVHVSDDKIQLVSGHHVQGYHPGDTEFWYRTQAACQAHPRLPLDSSLGVD